MQDYLKFIDAVDSLPQDFDFNTLYKLKLPNDPRAHGFMFPDIVGQIPWTDDFEISHEKKTVTLKAPSSATSPEDVAVYCTEAFNAVVRGMLPPPDDSANESKKLFPRLVNKESEPYLLAGTHPPVSVQRFSSPLFGVSSRGAHMTIYVRDPAAPAPEGLRIWVPTRSHKSFTFPGLLDTSVAGGVKADHSPRRCVEEEALEEASLDVEMEVDTEEDGSKDKKKTKKKLKEMIEDVGLITYVSKGKKYNTITPTLLYVFDLEVGPDIVLKPNDSEVDKFDLMTVSEVKEAMVAGRFKPNCNLVMMDFFIRHGIMTDEKANGTIMARLKRKLPVPIAPDDDGWSEHSSTP